jgi:L-fuconolactonase
VAFVERLSRSAPRAASIAGVVAFVDLTDPQCRDRTLDALSAARLTRGVRQNIQGQVAGWALQRAFVEGVREVGRRGLTFDLCATHDQLAEVTELVRQCPDTRFILDHCGKPAIRAGCLEPWRADVARLAECEQVVACKLSGLLTEADPARGREDDLLPYAEHAVSCFGTRRLLFGSDWPVLTCAGRFADWYGCTERLTAGWSADERRGFYRDNAVRVYGL